MPRLTSLLAICAASSLLVASPFAQGNPITVNLVPDNPGPYFGGESLTVDVWLHSDFEYDVLLQIVQFDFAATDPALNLAPVFEFDFDHSKVEDLAEQYLPTTLPNLPAPFTTTPLNCDCATRFIILGRQTPLHIGSVGLQLPTDPGGYVLDALNPTEQRTVLNEFGSWIVTPLASGLPGYNGFPQATWLARDGDISGGVYEFEVIPEPATIVLTGLAGVFLAFKHRRVSRVSFGMEAR